MPDSLQSERRQLIKQLIDRNNSTVHAKCDAWIERQSGGKYRSMLAVVEGDDSDLENRRKLLTELTAILRDGELIKLEEEA